MALVMITHEGIDRREVQDLLHRRWPDVVMTNLEREVPTVTMSPSDAADLWRCRRGVEPLRIVIMPQHDRQVIASEVEAMPVVVIGRVAHDRRVLLGPVTSTAPGYIGRTEPVRRQR